ncbi:MAG: gephyrin-like molybdotransferase Glp [Burkholderiaceae bacterium]
MNLLPIEQVRAILAQHCQAGSALSQPTPIGQALGKVLALPVAAPLNVPPHDNSAMDGYAFNHAELLQRHGNQGVWQVPVASRRHAGQAQPLACPPGQCVQVMTGAVMPQGTDTVVPQEQVQAHNGHASWDAQAVRQGANRRLCGEDLTQGHTMLAGGRVLRPADVGLLASVGLAQVAVRPPLRVAFFSTGNELRDVGQPLPEGCIYDSNRYTMAAMLHTLGVQAIDLGIVPDDPAALRDAFAQAGAQADVVITSGGVSVGEADHTKAVMRELGDVAFWQIAIQPGRPMAFGRMHNGPLLFGLPGNPVAVMVTFYVLVRPALLTLMGATAEADVGYHAVAAETLRKKPGRTEFRRGVITRSASNQWQVRTTGGMGSGILRSMSEANCLIELSADTTEVSPGQWLTVWPFDGLS